MTGGVHNSGDNVTYHGPVAGGDMVNGPGWPGPEFTTRTARTAEVAVLTILGEETRAVGTALRRMRDYKERHLKHGPLAREAWLPAIGGGQVRIAAVQTLTRGTESAAVAYRGLVEEYNPATVLLVGIAGGVSDRVEVGDVVLADEIIAYDARRESAEGTHRRGQAQAVAAPLGHRLNDFETSLPGQALDPDGAPFHIHRGAIGSGNAVVTDAQSEIRHWLTTFNEKVLAVETEAAGVAQSFHESVRGDNGPRGWLAIRGISDTADEHKGHDYHDLAARRAATVMAMLVPYLSFGA